MLFLMILRAIGSILVSISLTPGLDLFGVACDSAFSRYTLNSSFSNNLFVLAEESRNPDLSRFGWFAADLMDYYAVWRDTPEGLHPDVAGLIPAFRTLLSKDSFSVRSLVQTNGSADQKRCHAIIDIAMAVPQVLQSYPYRSQRVRAVSERSVLRGEALLAFEIQPILGGLFGYRYAYLNAFRKDRRIHVDTVRYMQLIREMDDLPRPDKRPS